MILQLKKVYQTLVTAQYWKLSKSNTLVNKDQKWQFSKVKWTLPAENDVSVIKDTSSGKVLGLLNEGFNVSVELEDTKSESNDSQMWLRGPSINGWFRMINCSSRQVLTAEGTSKTIITGKKLLHICIFYHLKSRPN